MKRVKKTCSKFIALSTIYLIITLPAFSQDVVIDKIVAKVDDFIVLKSDLEKAYLEYLSRGEFRGANARCQILESLIVNKMLVAKSLIDSVEVSDEEVQGMLSQKIEYLVSQLGTVEELEKYYGKTMEQFEEELFEMEKEKLIIQRMQGEITAGLKVSPAEVKKFYNNIPKDSLPYFSTEVQAAQIVKIPEAGKEQIEKAREQLNEIRARIVNGESFDVLARIYSEDPGSAAQGGQLPFFKRGDLAPEFEATAMTMKPGELSRPVKTDFGLHLIELQERRGNTFRSRHILLIPKPSAKDVQSSRDFLDSLRKEIVRDSISFEDAAKEFSDDKMTADNGGFFTDQEGSSRVIIDQLDPTIFFTLDTMQVGTISESLPFQQPDGSTAFRMLYFEDKIPPHQANLKQDYQRIAKATLESKKAKLLNEWFDSARGDVYIEIDPEFDSCDLLAQ
ncbi:MAG: peptidylprolyl isomerase [Bacteroidota bacterium]